MKIQYRHIMEPEKEKICDSEIQRFFRDDFSRMFHFETGGETQEEYDTWLLDKFQKDKEKGLILSYEVIEE